MTPEELRGLVADKLEPRTWYCLQENDYTPKRYLSWILHIDESEVSRICGMYGSRSRLNSILGSEGVKILPATQNETIGTGLRWFCVNTKPTDKLGVTLGVSAQVKLVTKSCSEYDNRSSSTPSANLPRRRTSERRTTLEVAAARKHLKRPASAISSGDLLSSSYGAASMELPSSSSSSSSPPCFDSQPAPPSRPRTNDNYASPEEAVENMKEWYKSIRPGRQRKAALAALVENASREEQTHVLTTLLLQHGTTEEGNSTEEKPIHATLVEQMRSELLNYNTKLQWLVSERQKKLGHLPEAETRGILSYVGENGDLQLRPLEERRKLASEKMPILVSVMVGLLSSETRHEDVEKVKRAIQNNTPVTRRSYTSGEANQKLTTEAQKQSYLLELLEPALRATDSIVGIITTATNGMCVDDGVVQRSLDELFFGGTDGEYDRIAREFLVYNRVSLGGVQDLVARRYRETFDDRVLVFVDRHSSFFDIEDNHNPYFKGRHVQKLGADGSSGGRSIASISRLVDCFKGKSNVISLDPKRPPAFTLVIGREGILRAFLTAAAGYVPSGYSPTAGDQAHFNRDAVPTGTQPERHLRDFVAAPSRQGNSSDRRDWAHNKHYPFWKGKVGGKLKELNIDRWSCCDTEFNKHDCYIAHSAAWWHALLKRYAVSPCVSHLMFHAIGVVWTDEQNMDCFFLNLCTDADSPFLYQTKKYEEARRNLDKEQERRKDAAALLASAAGDTGI